VKFPKESTDKFTDAGERRAGVTAEAGDKWAGGESRQSSGPRFRTVSLRTGAGVIGVLKALRAEPRPETGLELAWPWLPGWKPDPLVMIGRRYGTFRHGESGKIPWDGGKTVPGFRGAVKKRPRANQKQKKTAMESNRGGWKCRMRFLLVRESRTPVQEMQLGTHKQVLLESG
jgi:hypothetical protein